MTAARPPRVAAWLVRQLGGPEGEMLALDMAELHALRCRGGRFAAWRWYWRHTLVLAAARLQHPTSFSPRAARALLVHPRRRPVRKGFDMITSVLNDLRFAVRGFRRTPVTTGLALLTLALGIGVNTAFFSVLNAVVLQPLPIPEPDRLVAIGVGRALGTRQTSLIDEEMRTIEASAPYSAESFTLHGDGPPEIVRGLLVGVEMDAVFRTPPVTGRTFTTADGVLGAEPVVVLSYALWQRRFGGDPAVVGRSIAVEGFGASARTVIGVMPAWFRPLASLEPAVYVPVIVDRSRDDWSHYIRYRLLGRLTATATPLTAHTELAAIVERHAGADEEAAFWEDAVDQVFVRPFHETQVETVSAPFWVLMGAVGLILMMTCVNVANLLLARAGARAQELTTRIALGAGRGRVMRQLMTEHLLLAAVGGGLGLATAAATLDGLVATLPANVPRTGDVRVDGTVLAFTLAASLVAGIVFGILPAIHATSGSRTSLTRAATADRKRRHVNYFLVGGEVALAVVLVTGAGLFAKSLLRLYAVDPGFTVERLYSLRVTPPAERYPPDSDERWAYIERVVSDLETVPGVRAAGATTILPMTQTFIGVGISLTGEALPPGQTPDYVSYRTVSPGYFAAMEIPILAGRTFDASDPSEGASVGVINEYLAERIWPGEDAVGRQVVFGDGSPWFTVIGVVKDVYHALDDERPIQVYMSMHQESSRGPFFVALRAEVDTPVFAAARARLEAIDPRVPISEESTMADLVDASVATPRFFLILFVLLGALAVTLGAVGIYGVMASTVSQQTREIGIRVALGAGRGVVVRQTMRRGLLWAGGGIGAGVVASLLAGGAVRSLLFGITPHDPAVLGGVAALLGTVAVAACYLTARRAAGVDPVVSLRSE